MATLDALPDVLVVSVLSGLDSETLLRSVALCSKRLRSLATSEVTPMPSRPLDGRRGTAALRRPGLRRRRSPSLPCCCLLPHALC